MALSPEAIQWQTAHITDDRTGYFIASVSAVMSVATICVLARLAARQWTKVGFGPDDYTIVIALLIAWGMFVGNIYETRYGEGKHEIASTLDQLTAYAKVLFFEDLSYCTATLVIQTSFLLFYRRVFTMQSPPFRLAIYVIGAFAYASWISIFVATLLLCQPIAYNWDKSIDGTCVNPNAVFISGLSINLFTDLCIVLLPIPMIWQIQINRAEKWAVLGAFILGGFCCVGNLIRLPYLVGVQQDDLTWSLLNGELWGTAEVCIGIISACLPCYRPFLRSIKNKWSSRSWSKGSGTKASNTSRSSSKPRSVAIGASTTAPRHRWDTLSREGQLMGEESETRSERGPDSQFDVEESLRQSISVQQDLHMSSAPG
ncbi:MAG: hypothetical protein M1838_002293 [Thelocarpon superellum]|nr:MAG: hypothetical protein M1838_002293 [Thelocarpon superellum]